MIAKVTSALSPAFRDTLLKAFSSFTGLVTDAYSSLTYNCTTSAPSYGPSLVTVMLTMARALADGTSCGLTASLCSESPEEAEVTGLASPDRSHPRLVRGRGPSLAMGGAERSEESGLPEPDANRIKEVRGRGLMIGVEFDGPIAEIRRKLLFDKHIFTGVSGKNMIRLLAPLVLSKDDVDIFIKALEEVL